MEQAASLAQGMQRQASLDSLRAHLTSIEGEGKDVRAGAGPGGEGGRTRSMDLEQQVKVLQGELDELDERWEEQESHTSEHLNDVFFYDEERGWAVGNNGTILFTEDGGEIWSTQFSGTQSQLHGVCFVNLAVGFAVGESGTIVHTEDGGVN